MEFREFAPVRKAEAAGVAFPPVSEAAPAPEGLVTALPAPVVAAPVAAPAAPPAGPTVVFVGQDARSRPFPLAHPVSVDGRRLDVIALRRPSAAEVGRWFEEYFAAIERDPGALVYFPVFVDIDGAPLSAAVLDALDDDDREMLFEWVADFLPRRLLPFRGSGDRGSAPSTGAPTAQT